MAKPPPSPTVSRPSRLFIPPYSPKASSKQLAPPSPSLGTHSLRRLPSLEELQRKYVGHSAVPSRTISRPASPVTEEHEGSISSNSANQLNLPELDTILIVRGLPPKSTSTFASTPTGSYSSPCFQQQPLLCASPSRRFMLPLSAMTRAGIPLQPPETNLMDKMKEGEEKVKQAEGDKEPKANGPKPANGEESFLPAPPRSGSHRNSTSPPMDRTKNLSSSSPSSVRSSKSTSPSPPKDHIDAIQTKLLDEINKLGVAPVSPTSAGLAVIPVPTRSGSSADLKVPSDEKKKTEVAKLSALAQQDKKKWIKGIGASLNKNMVVENGVAGSPPPRASDPDETDSPFVAPVSRPTTPSANDLFGTRRSALVASPVTPLLETPSQASRPSSPASQASPSPSPQPAESPSPTPGSPASGPRAPTALIGNANGQARGKRVQSLTKLRDRMLARGVEKMEAAGGGAGSTAKPSQRESGSPSETGSSTKQVDEASSTKDKSVNKENIIPLAPENGTITKGMMQTTMIATTGEEDKVVARIEVDGGADSALQALGESMGVSKAAGGSKPEHPYPLSYTWVLHRDDTATDNGKGNINTPNMREAQYAQKLNILDKFDTVIGFASTFSNEQDMSRMQPSRLPLGSNIHLFKEGIMPMYEDPANQNGGRWTLMFKGPSQGPIFDQTWAYLILAIVGGHFPVSPCLIPALEMQRSPAQSKAVSDQALGEAICGAVASRKKGVLRIQIWVRDKADVLGVNEAGRRLLDVLDIDEGSGVAVDFQPHDTGRKLSVQNPYFSLNGLPSRPRIPTSASVRGTQPGSPSPASRFVPASLVRAGSYGEGVGGLASGSMGSFRSGSPLPRSSLNTGTRMKDSSGLPPVSPGIGYKSSSGVSIKPSEIAKDTPTKQDTEMDVTPKTFASGYLLQQAGLPINALMAAVQDSPSAGRGSSRRKPGNEKVAGEPVTEVAKK